MDHAIPTIAHWRLASLPKYLSIEAVERGIASCNLSLPIGVRDKAILLLLARLGLRAGDVAGLMVSAIDCDRGRKALRYRLRSLPTFHNPELSISTIMQSFA